MEQLTGKDRLIVALDVPTVDEALRTVERLDNVSFFKVGLQLLLTGGMPLLLQTLRNTKRLFVDLKVPGDIANTVAAVIDMCVENNVWPGRRSRFQRQAVLSRDGGGMDSNCSICPPMIA